MPNLGVAQEIQVPDWNDPYSVPVDYNGARRIFIPGELPSRGISLYGDKWGGQQQNYWTTPDMYLPPERSGVDTGDYGTTTPVNLSIWDNLEQGTVGGRDGYFAPANAKLMNGPNAMDTGRSTQNTEFGDFKESFTEFAPMALAFVAAVLTAGAAFGPAGGAAGSAAGTGAEIGMAGEVSFAGMETASASASSFATEFASVEQVGSYTANAMDASEAMTLAGEGLGAGPSAGSGWLGEVGATLPWYERAWNFANANRGAMSLASSAMQVAGGVGKGLLDSNNMDKKIAADAALADRAQSNKMELENFKRGMIQSGSYGQGTLPVSAPAQQRPLTRPDESPVYGPRGLILARR